MIVVFFRRIFFSFFILFSYSMSAVEGGDGFFPAGEFDDSFVQQEEELDLNHFQKALNDEGLVPVVNNLSLVLSQHNVAVFEYESGEFLFKHVKNMEGSAETAFYLFDQPNLKIEIAREFDEEESLDDLKQLFEIEYLYSLRQSSVIKKIKEFEQLYFSTEALDLTGLEFIQDEYLENKYDLIYIKKMIQAAYLGNLEALKRVKVHFGS